MEKLKFPTQLQQEQLFSSLKSLNNELYGILDPNLRTLSLCLTGDGSIVVLVFTENKVKILIEQLY